MNRLIVGNQKMYMDYDDVASFISSLKELDTDSVIICPSYPYLKCYEEVVKVGAQNVSTDDNGAHTGEVSASQLQSLNVSHCIIGHSERREYQKESDEEINQKMHQLLAKNIVPILCIGEKLEDRQSGLTTEVLRRELHADLKDVSSDAVAKIVIAYEPIWAIGSGVTPSDEEIDEAIRFIKEYLSETLNCQCRVLYGGSVSEKNIDSLNEIPSIDGYLIGGASTKIDSFKYIVNSQKRA